MAVAEAERYGLTTLRRHGLEVSVLDLSALVRRRPVPSHLMPRDLLPVVRPPDADAFDALVRRETEAGSVFSDNLVALGDIDYGTEAIFRTLHRHRAPYIVVSAAALPRPGAGPDAGPKWLLAMAAKAADPVRAAGSLFERAAAQARSSGLLYPLPRTVFSGNSPLLARFKRRFSYPDDRVRPVQSLDYSAYLSHIAAGPDLAPDGTCVFLDEAATHHRDSYMLGTPVVEPVPYFEHMDRLFTDIERRWKLRVVVAAHPTSQYEAKDRPFGGRPLIKGRSMELVSKASLVVAHASTSVAFAVLFRKPLLFSLPPAMKELPTGDVTRTLAAALGTRPVESLEQAAEGPWPLDAARYDAYRDAYIRYPGVADEPVWQTVARTLGAKC